VVVRVSRRLWGDLADFETPSDMKKEKSEGSEVARMLGVKEPATDMKAGIAKEELGGAWRSLEDTGTVFDTLMVCVEYGEIIIGRTKGR